MRIEIKLDWYRVPCFNNRTLAPVNYSQIDAAALKLFSGTHPLVVQDWLPVAEGIFPTDPEYQPTVRERKHRRMLWLEKRLGVQFSKKHYQLVR